MIHALSKGCRRRLANLSRTPINRPYARQKSYRAWQELGCIPPEQVKRADGRLYKLRDYGNASLPLPPMLDPEYAAAKERHTKAKEISRAEDKSPLAQALERNVFAKALTTPIRQCSITRVHLPNHFLQPFQFFLEDGQHSGSSKRKVRCEPVCADAKYPNDPLSKHAWAALSKQVIGQLDIRRGWVRLFTPHIRERAAARLGLSTKALDAKYVSWRGATQESIDAGLHDRILKITDQIFRTEQPVALDPQQGRDDIGLFVTFGAEKLAVDILSSGSVHFSWTGQPSSEAVRERIARNGPQTYGLLYTKRMIRFGVAMDRLLAYNDVGSSQGEAE